MTENLISRIDAAMRRITSGQACMRIPPEDTDPDLVLADCKRALQGAGAVPGVSDALAAWGRLQSALTKSDWRSYDPKAFAIVDQFFARAILARAPAAAEQTEEGLVHQAVSTSSGPSGVHSGDAGVSAPRAAGSAWISVEERMPEPGTDCLVWCTARWRPGVFFAKVERWDELREQPVSWSSATVPVGLGWGDSDYEDITHWQPIEPPASGSDHSSAPTVNAAGTCPQGAAE